MGVVWRSNEMNVRHEVNAANPGETLACCGIAVLAAQANAGAETGFVREGAKTIFVAPELDLHKQVTDGNTDPSSHLVAGVNLDWWERWGLNQNMKLWAGQKKPATIIRNLLKAAPDVKPNESWLRYEALAGGRLDVDPKGTWNALELGWSIDKHHDSQMLCRPFVELLAMVGLQEFPVRGDKHAGYLYSLWRPASCLVARFAFTGYGHHILADCKASTARNGENATLKSATVEWRGKNGG